MVVALSPPMTADEFRALPDDGRRLELVDGYLQEKNVSWRSCKYSGRLFGSVFVVNPNEQLGVAFPQDTPFACFPDPATIRKPDFAFIATGRYTQAEQDASGYIRVVPDIAAEVVSPNDYAYDVDRKVEEYLEAGVKLVWVVQPEAKYVDVHRANGGFQRLQLADALSGEAILPGFKLPLGEFFKE